MIIAALVNCLRVVTQTVVGGSRWSRTRKIDVARLDDALGILKRDARLKEAMLEELRGAARVCAPSRLHRSSYVDLAELIRSTTDLLRPVAAHGGVTILARCAATSVIAPGDPTDVTHIVSGVLACAIASSEGGDAVDCELSVDGDWLTVNVAVHRSAAEVASPAGALEPSTGGCSDFETGVWADLGFATIRELVERHGGVVHVEIDQRSRRPLFGVWLPGERGTAG